MIHRKWGQGAKAMGVYTYLTDGVSVELKQMMPGVRKWKLDLLDRSELMSLFKRATKITGIRTAEEVDKDVMEKKSNNKLFSFFLEQLF